MMTEAQHIDKDEEIRQLRANVADLRAKLAHEEYDVSEEQAWSSELYEIIKECKPFIPVENKNSELIGKIQRVILVASD